LRIEEENWRKTGKRHFVEERKKTKGGERGYPSTKRAPGWGNSNRTEEFQLKGGPKNKAEKRRDRAPCVSWGTLQRGQARAGKARKKIPKARDLKRRGVTDEGKVTSQKNKGKTRRLHEIRSQLKYGKESTRTKKEK